MRDYPLSIQTKILLANRRKKKKLFVFCENYESHRRSRVMRESKTNKNKYGLEGFCSRRTALISGRMLKALTHIQQSFTSVLSWCEPTTCCPPHRLTGATVKEQKLLSSALSLRGYHRSRTLLSAVFCQLLPLSHMNPSSPRLCICSAISHSVPPLRIH